MMQYTVETTENGVVETLVIEGETYKKEWVRDGGCLRCQQKDFAAQMKDDEISDDLLLERVEEVFDGFIASSVDDIREILED